MSKNMQTSLIAARYASALFDMASAAKALDAVGSDLDSLVQLEKQNRDLRTLLTSPLVTRADAQKALIAILTKGKAHEVTQKFLSMLAENRRLDIISAVAKAFGELVEQSRGEMTADVEVATTIDAAMQKQVADSLTKATGKKIKLRIHEKPSLLGGMVVNYGGKRLDLSVSGRLDRLSQSLKRA